MGSGDDDGGGVKANRRRRRPQESVDGIGDECRWDVAGGGGDGGKRRRFEKGLESGVEEEEGPGVLVVDAAAGAGSWMTWGEGLGGGATEVEGSGEIDGGCREWGAGCRATSVKKRSRAGGRRPTERLTPEKSRTKM
jgi:hypothetical protein